MEIQRSEPNTPQKAIERLTINEKPNKKKHNKKERQYASLSLNITPSQYRGMHLLGNFRPSISWNIRQDSELRDHRLALLPSTLFLNRTVLDVGCGEGKTSIQVAMRFFPKHIIALDIDAQLLERTTKLIDKIVARNSLYLNRSEMIAKRVSELPLYFQQQFQKNQEKINPQIEILPEGVCFQSNFPENISIYNENFLNLKTDKKYETLMMLRTCKWIHLALGDKGLIALFEKAYDLLEDNGILILEYPLYRSYQKKKSMNSLYSKNMQTIITIDPLTFPSILSNMGFDLFEEVQSKTDYLLKHPLVILKKIPVEREGKAVNP